MCSIRAPADEAHARYSAARADLLSAVAELASTEAWRGDGAGDLPSWLAARWQISRRTARELVRDAEALEARPALSAALRAGAISVDQCKALTVLCREQTDDAEAWLEALPFWSLPELEREARKQVARELERRDDGVYLRMRHTDDERYLRGEFQLHPEDGATLLAAIDARVPNGTRLRDWDHASATALVELAKGCDVAAQRPTVLLSVSQATLAGDPAADSVASLSSGGFVGIETARRLSCDARNQVLYKDEEGKITGIGRTSRSISSALRRAVEERDGGKCTFPSCERASRLTTSSTWRRAARPSCRTSFSCAGRTTTWCTKANGGSAERRGRASRGCARTEHPSSHGCASSSILPERRALGSAPTLHVLPFPSSGYMTVTLARSRPARVP